MLISIIVPVYNAANYIERCLNSILHQSFTSYEVILVDDGSTDDSLEICKKYSNRYDIIKLIHQRNSGVSAARNAGLKEARGEYVTFIDSDDWIHCNYLQKLYTCTKDSGAQIALCGYIETGEIVEDAQTSIGAQIKVFNNREAIEYFGNANLARKSAHFRSPWAKLIKREFVINRPFPVDRTYAEDGACVYLWFWQADKIAYTEEILYYYYQNEMGICHKPVGTHVIGNFLTEAEWISFFKKYKFRVLCQGFCKRYITDTLWAYENSEEKEAKELFRRVMRSGLLKYRRSAKLRFEDTTGYFEIVYPRMMRLYWFYKSQSSRWKKRN